MARAQTFMALHCRHRHIFRGKQPKALLWSTFLLNEVIIVTSGGYRRQCKLKDKVSMKHNHLHVISSQVRHAGLLICYAQWKTEVSIWAKKAACLSVTNAWPSRFWRIYWVIILHLFWVICIVSVLSYYIVSVNFYFIYRPSQCYPNKCYVLKLWSGVSPVAASYIIRNPIGLTWQESNKIHKINAMWYAQHKQECQRKKKISTSRGTKAGKTDIPNVPVTTKDPSLHIEIHIA